VKNFKKSLDQNKAWERLSFEVTHVFDFFHCPIFVKHAVSYVDCFIPLDGPGLVT